MFYQIGDLKVGRNAPVLDPTTGRQFATMGDLVDAWKARHGNPGNELVGKDARKALERFCRDRNVRTEDPK